MAWEAAYSADSAESYNAFLREYPESQYAPRARRAIQSLAWEQAHRLNSIEAYEQFLAAYPDSKHADDARHGIEDIEWQRAVNLNTIGAYLEFMSSHPDSQHGDDAHERMDTLIGAAQGAVGLEQLLKASPDLAIGLVPRLEQALIDEIRTKGPREHYVVSGFFPSSEDATARVTMSPMKGVDAVTHTNTEFDGDVFAVALDGVNGINMRLQYGPGSIHRFDGAVRQGAGDVVIFRGEGDRANRLTFGVVPGVGYVYLRGKGTLVLKSGREIRLGY
jgi:hypothetical protein